MKFSFDISTVPNKTVIIHCQQVPIILYMAVLYYGEIIKHAYCYRACFVFSEYSDWYGLGVMLPLPFKKTVQTTPKPVLSVQVSVINNQGWLSRHTQSILGYSEIPGKKRAEPCFHNDCIPNRWSAWNKSKAEAKDALWKSPLKLRVKELCSTSVDLFYVVYLCIIGCITLSGCFLTNAFSNYKDLFTHWHWTK